MTHGLATLLAALALLTGLVLGSLGKVGLHPPSAIPAVETRNQQIGRQYYKALDVLMLTGDERAMRLLLDEEFRDHQFAMGAAVDVERLIAEYQSLRSVIPGSRYVVEELDGAGDLVIATLGLHLAGQPAFAGIEIELGLPRSLQEILRIRDGVVVERWSNSSISPGLTTLATLGEIAFIGVPELQRWQFEPHAADTMHARSEAILMVEKGELVIEPEHLPDQTPVRRWSNDPSQKDIDPEPLFDTQQVKRGDVLHIPNGAVVKFWNYSDQPASMLTIAGHSSGRYGPQYTDGADGIHRQLLARGFSLGSVIPAFAVAVGLVELSPGSEFIHREIPGGGEFAIVTDGLLTATAPGGLIWTADERAVITSNEQQDLPTGTGAAIADGSEVRFAASQTAASTFLIVTFIPVARHP